MAAGSEALEALFERSGSDGMSDNYPQFCPLCGSRRKDLPVPVYECGSHDDPQYMRVVVTEECQRRQDLLEMAIVSAAFEQFRYFATQYFAQRGAVRTRGWPETPFPDVGFYAVDVDAPTAHFPILRYINQPK